MAIKFSTNYAPPAEQDGVYNGLSGFRGFGAFDGVGPYDGLDRSAYGAFYGTPDDPRAGLSLLRSVSGCGSCSSGYGRRYSAFNQDEAPSRATWFVLGAATVLLWPTITSLLSFVPRKTR